MTCNRQADLGPLSNLGIASGLETIGLRFTAQHRYCTGGWVYTGSGPGWVGVDASLFRVSDQALLIRQHVPTGNPNTVYPFIWSTPQPVALGADYVIAFNKIIGSGYAGALGGPVPPADEGCTPISWLFALGDPAFPSSPLTSSAGIFPQLCTSTAGYCQYGTQLQPGANFLYYLTPELIDVWLTAIGAPWLAPIFTAVWFTSIDAQSLCASGPPDVSFITATSPANFSSSQILALIQAVAWTQICQCVPGAPSPAPYPPLTITQPPGWIPVANPTCGNTDVCSFLELIYSQLSALNQKCSQMKLDIDLLQRYSLPFAYINGAVHSNLTGDGSFAISRLLGIKSTIVTPPSSFVSAGNPPYLYNVGWLAVNTADGITREHRLAHTNDVWVPEDMALSTELTYHFNPGVVVTLQELQAEP